MPSVARLVPPVSVRVPAAAGRVALDGGRVDAALGGGLALAGCHEIYGPAATALALMLALASARSGPILWLADPRGDDGRLYGAGLVELGGDPGRVWLVAAGYAVACQFPIYLMRSSAFTALELAQTLRYLADLVIVLALLAAVAFCAPTRPGQRWLDASPARSAAVLGVATAFVASSLFSTATFLRSW